MGNGTKVALVALLILMVVVIARFVRNDSGEQSTTATTAQPKATQQPQAKPPEAGKSKAITVSPSGAAGSAQASATAPREKAQVALQPPRPVPGSNSNVPVSTAPSQNLVVANSPPTPLPGSVSGGGTSSQTGATQPPTVARAAAVADSGGLPQVAGVTQAPGGGSIPPKPVLGPPSSGGAEGIVRSGSSVPPGIRPPSPINAPGGALPLVTTELKTEASRVPSGSQSPSHQPGQGPADAEKGSSVLSQHFPKPQPVPGGSSATPSPYPITYTVEKNDSYWVIAQKQYKDATLWQTIEKANPGIKLIPGKTLSIPAPPVPKVVVAEELNSDRVPGARASKTPRITTADAKSSGGRAENAQKSLSPIARIAQQGKQIGQEGKSATVPSRAKVNEASVKTAEYVVKRGDTLSRIAKRFYNDPSKYDLIEDANENLKYGTLQEGAKLVIPLVANQ